MVTPQLADPLALFSSKELGFWVGLLHVISVLGPEVGQAWPCAWPWKLSLCLQQLLVVMAVATSQWEAALPSCQSHGRWCSTVPTQGQGGVVYL